MRIVITGGTGQLGRALTARLASRHTVLPISHADCPVEDPAAIDVIEAQRPDLVIHSAAMTHVDGCALDPDRAEQVNARGTRNVALACKRSAAPLVYISTNEVFSGQASAPYRELDKLEPANPYGRSKALGEQYVQLLLREFYIVRTAWVFGPGGNNFVSKILRAARTGQSMRVVTDEISNPSYAPDLAEAIDALIDTRIYGIYHLTNHGICSRYEYAREVLDRCGLADVPIQPIVLADFDRPSTPPPFAPLANICAAELGISLRPWQDALGAYLAGRWPELAA